MYSRPALKTLLPFCIGLVAAKVLSPELSVLLLCVTVFLVVLVIGTRLSRRNISLVFLIALALAGGLRYETATHLPPDHIAYLDKRAELSLIFCEAVDYPDRRDDRTLVTVEILGIQNEDSVRQCSGKVLLSLDRSLPAPAYGDLLAVEGRLRLPLDQRNPDAFDYRKYLQSQGIYRTMFVRSWEQIALISHGEDDWFFRNLVFPLKDYLDRYITRTFPKSEAGLLRGLTIGERGGVEADLRDAFSDVGVIHVLAVSGLHVGFIVLILMVLGSVLRLPYGVRVCLTTLGLVVFCCLTGLKPPVIRASIMAAFLLLGGCLERRTDVYNTLACAALLILLWRPQELFLPGFQLSFSAVFSIVYFYPRLKLLRPVAYFNRNRLLRYPIGLALVSIAAFLGTLPFTVVYFHKVTLFSIVSNLVVIPLTFLSVAGCYLAATVNLLSPYLAKLYGNSTWLSAHLMIAFVRWSESLPMTHIDAYGLTWVHHSLYLCLVLGMPGGLKLWMRKICFGVFLALTNLLVWQGVLDNEDEMTITFIDVGQGDSVLLSLPDDRHVLYDGGPRNLRFDAGERIVAPFLKSMGIKRLDAVIVSHADSDHLGGIPYLLGHFEVGSVWDNGHAKQTQLYNDYLAVIDSLAIPRRILHAGELVLDFEPVIFFVLHPTGHFIERHEGNHNEGSLSFKLTYGETDILLLGDVEQDGEAYIASYGDWLQSELMKADHHGSSTSNAKFLLENVRPQTVVVSVGAGNRFGHPDPEVLKRFGDCGAAILRTDLDAAVLLRSDGNRLRLIDWR